MEYPASSIKARNLITNGRHLPYNPELVKRAQEMRKNPTLAEKKLWEVFLRKFRYRVLRQRVIDNFIVDFYIPQIKLIIEVDGEIHKDRDISAYDEERTKILESYGVTIVRFNNELVMNDIKAVIEVIEKYLER